MLKRQAEEKDLENVWRQIIEQQKASGLNVKDFCGAEGLKGYSFWYWRQAITKSDRLAKHRRTSKNLTTPAHHGAGTDNRPPRTRESVIVKRARREEEFWLTLLQEWQDSGLGMRPFAESKNVPYRSKRPAS